MAEREHPGCMADSLSERRLARLEARMSKLEATAAMLVAELVEPGAGVHPAADAFPRTRALAAQKLPSTAELTEALLAPGRLRDQPAVQQVLRATGRHDLLPPPALAIVEGPDA